MNGITYGTTFTDVTADTADHGWARFGVRVKNTSGTDVEAALVQLRVDYRR